MEKSPIPVSILVGFLGSGKTTLLNHILSSQHNRKIAVIVNEFGAINVDAKLVRHTTERIVQMSNGCICCTLRGDLLQELRELSKIKDLEYILIESTGIAEPMPIAQTFYMEDMEELVRLDSIITVVDAANFWSTYDEEGEVLDVDGNITTEPLASLLVDQLEFTNIVLINKADLVPEADLAQLESFILRLNPETRIFRTVQGVIDPQELINTGLYDYEHGAEAEDWAAEWDKPSSEAEEYGFSSFVFRSEAPLRWDAFDKLLSSKAYAQVTRSKGIAFFEDHDPVFLSQASNLCQIETLQPLSPEDLEEAEGVYTTELVFIGLKLPKPDLLNQLEACRGAWVPRQTTLPG